MILHKQLILTLSFALSTASLCNANEIPLYTEKTTQQKAGGIVKEGSISAICFFVASFIMKGLVPQEWEQAVALLLGTSATALANHKTVKQAVTHPMVSAKDPETAGKVLAMVVGGVAGNYGSRYTSGAKRTFENLRSDSNGQSNI
jgi:hypothetical protein